MQEKNLQLDRTVFFCDAVVAIAITLLAFNLKIVNTADGHLSFSDIIRQWKTFAAFFLSFFNIANFWKAHHSFYAYIKKMDEKLLWYNILWLLFIVLLPFSTSLVSNYFGTPAIVVYSLNTLLVAVFQNYIWDYSCTKQGYIKETEADKDTFFHIRLFCNLEMINALIAIVLAFFKPGLAFIFLFTKLPMILLAGIYVRREKKKESRKPLEKAE